MLERFGITHDAYGGGSAGLYGYHHGIVGKEAARTFPEKLETFAQAVSDKPREPEVQGRRNQSGAVRRGGQVEAQFLAGKVCHPLCGSRLPHVSLLPADLFQLFLETHHRQRVYCSFFRLCLCYQGFGLCFRRVGESFACLQLQVGMGEVFRAEFHHHPRVAPFRTPVAGAHSVHHYLVRTACRRHHESSGAHAEAVYAPSVYLLHEAVFRRGQVFSPSRLVVVLDLVDEHRRVFQPYSYSDAFRLDVYVVGIKPAVHVACRMSCGKDDGAAERLARIRFDARHFIVFDDERVHACLEVHLPSAGKDGVAHVLDDARQFVRPDVRVCVDEDGGVRSVLAEHVQYLFHVSPLLAPGIELSVRVGTCSAFAEAVVRFGVHFVLTADACQVFLAFAYVFPPFYHDGTQPQFYQFQCREQSSRSGSHDDDGRFPLHVAVFSMCKSFFFGHFVDEHPYFQVDEDGSLACVDASFQYAYRLDGPCVQPLLPADVLLDVVIACCLFGQYS